MIRKLIKVGQAYSVTMPIDWVRNNKLKQGDEIRLSDNGEKIIFSHAKEKPKKKYVVNIGISKEQAVHQLICLYRKGIDEIHVNFNDPVIITKYRKEERTGKALQEAISNLIGFSVVEHKPKSLIIKDISGANYESFDLVLKRAFFLLKNLTEETTRALREKNKDSLEEIPHIYSNVIELVHYSIRLLNKNEHELEKTAHLYSIINYLSEIADSYRHVAKHFARKDIKITDEQIDVFNDTNKLVDLMFNLFYKPNNQKFEEFFELRDLISEKYRAFKHLEQGIMENNGYLGVFCTSIIREIMLINEIDDEK